MKKFCSILFAATTITFSVLPQESLMLSNIVQKESIKDSVESTEPAKSSVQIPQQTIEYKEVFETGINLEEVHDILAAYNGSFSENFITRILENSTDYRAYIRKRLAELKMPACIEYLPIIESDYKPTAKPPAGTSMGLWQFMPNSVSPFMELSEYVDERRDPWISTEGALKKLNDNFNQFGDWLLALAAYNCGAGAVKRALQKAKIKTYTGLCQENLIPNHAKIYVKKFLAISDLIMNAKLKGLEKIEIANHIDCIDNEYFFYNDFDYVTVNQSISLHVLAMELKMDFEILHQLNLSLVKDVTPPNREYTIRVPKGMKLSCTEAVMNILSNKL